MRTLEVIEMVGNTIVHSASWGGQKILFCLVNLLFENY